MTPAELLAEAARLLRTVAPGTRGRWPKACAWLIRMALEKALDDYWARVLPAAASCGMRPQLLLLPRYAGSTTAAEPRHARLRPARATPHHAYHHPRPPAGQPRGRTPQGRQRPRPPRRATPGKRPRHHDLPRHHELTRPADRLPNPEARRS